MAQLRTGKQASSVKKTWSWYYTGYVSRSALWETMVILILDTRDKYHIEQGFPNFKNKGPVYCPSSFRGTGQWPVGVKGKIKSSKWPHLAPQGANLETTGLKNLRKQPSGTLP